MSQIFVCPHWKDLDSSTFNLLFSKVSRARADKNGSMFYYLHTPVIVTDEHGTQRKEDEILNLFDPSDPRKVIVVIQGNTGTGKSELCLFLYFELLKKGRKVLLVEKNASLMDILSKDIPEFYYHLTGKQFPKKEKPEQLNKILRNAPKTVANNVASGLLLKLLDFREQEEDDTTNFVLEQLEAIVEKKLRILIQPGVVPVNMTFLEAEELRTGFLQKLADIAPGNTFEEKASELNRLLWETLRKIYEVETLDHAIEIISRDADNIRPVVVFEDFSIAGLDFDNLTKYMESDNPASICDFIIAGVHDKVPKRSGTRIERFRYFSTTTSEHPEVLFLNNDTCVRFIEKYLSYPKNSDYTKCEENKICRECKKCSIQQRILTPFNETFLRRIFSSSRIEERTPRLYVDRLREILNDYSLNSVLPFESNALSNLRIEYPVDDEMVPNPTIQNFANWYGSYKETFLEIESEIAEMFGIDAVEYEVNGVLRFPLVGQRVYSPSAKMPKTNQNVSNINDDDDSDTAFNNILGQWNIWKDDPGSDSVIEFRTYFNEGLKKVIEEVTGGYRLRIGSNIHLDIGQNEYPFSMEGVANAVEQSIEISPSLFSQKGSIALARIGFTNQRRAYTGKNKQTLFDEAISGNSYPIGRIVYEQRNGIMRNLQDKNWSKRCNCQYDLFEVVLACSRVLMIFEDPFRETSPLNIAKWLLQDEESPKYIPPSQSEKWLQTSLENIFRTRQIIKQVAIELFGLTSKNIDVRMLTKNSSGDPVFIVKHISTSMPSNIIIEDYGSLSDLLSPYKQIPQIIREINRVIMENGELDLFLNEANIVLSILKGLQPEEIKPRLKSLKEMGIGGDLLRSLSEISELSTDVIKEYQDRVTHLCDIMDSIDSNSETTDTLCFNIAVRIIANDYIIKSLYELSKSLKNQKILVEDEPLKVLVSMLRGLQENVC